VKAISLPLLASRKNNGVDRELPVNDSELLVNKSEILVNKSELLVKHSSMPSIDLLSISMDGDNNDTNGMHIYKYIYV
jgi:hypothetical protein